MLLRHQRIAAHARSTKAGSFTTVVEHMPASHGAHLQWTLAKLIAWGERIGAATAGVVRWQTERRPHPEQGRRASYQWPRTFPPSHSATRGVPQDVLQANLGQESLATTSIYVRAEKARRHEAVLEAFSAIPPGA